MHHDFYFRGFNTEIAMKKAMENVEKHYAVVGILEELNKTLTVLEHYVPRFFKGALNTYWSKSLTNVTRLIFNQWVRQYLFHVLIFIRSCHLYTVWGRSFAKGDIHKPCAHGRGRGFAKCPYYFIRLVHKGKRGVKNVQKYVLLVCEWPKLRQFKRFLIWHKTLYKAL